MKITVENIKLLTNGGNLKGFATVAIADKIRIHDVRIVRQDGQKPWASMPAQSFESGGQRRWKTFVELLDEDLKAAVLQAVLDEYAKADARPTTPAVGW